MPIRLTAQTGGSGAKKAFGLRLHPGVLRAPPLASRPIRLSETADDGDGRGWIEHALTDMEPGGLEPPARIAELIASIVSARVGGDFWQAPPAWSDAVRIAVNVHRPQDLGPAVELAFRLGTPTEVGLALPNRPWATRAAARLERRGLEVSIGATDPWEIIDRADQIVVAGDDELGLLALLAGRRVHCWRAGYLTGWGLTQDKPQPPLRGERRLWQLAMAALVTGVRYCDPFSGRMTTCEAVVEQLSDWRRIIDEDRDLVCCSGITPWKRARVRRFLAPLARRAPVIGDTRRCVERALVDKGAIAIWPSRAPAGLEAAATAAGVQLRRVEDGFLRSVGLGSDLLPPCSIVIDRSGIYYDPRKPSDLEKILSETEFPPALQERAGRLVTTLVARRLTKYNTGTTGYARPTQRRVVLVPGQVEDDQSWRFGGGDCENNLDLIRRVRQCEPDAFIVYKPHPDVEAGNRVGAAPDSEVLKFADQIVRDAAMPALLDCVDAVHVLTSLTGFEALLRGREVVTHGQPFYSGWGLTRDLSPPLRRARRLSLNELAAGALILYPRYLDPVWGCLCSPEVLVERLASQRPATFAGASPVRRVRQLGEKVWRWTAHLAPQRGSARS